MIHEPHIHSREVDKMIERQMRNWELARDTTPAATDRPAKPVVQDYVTISPAPGVSYAALTNALHDRVGWPVFDREVIHAMSNADSYRERIYSLMDEHDLGWLEEVLRGLTYKGFERNDYFHRLVSTVSTLARMGHGIFVGRGADLILPREIGLRVRLCASRKFSIQAFADEHKLSEHDAERAMDEQEHEKAKFLRHHFGAEETEPARHDLIINIERFSIANTVELITSAMALRGMAIPTHA